jgi:hypothetical protein
MVFLAACSVDHLLQGAGDSRMLCPIGSRFVLPTFQRQGARLNRLNVASDDKRLMLARSLLLTNDCMLIFTVC